MNKVEIGSSVKFIYLNVQFVGRVMDMKQPFAYVAVIGYGHIFAVPIDQCLPV